MRAFPGTETSEPVAITLQRPVLAKSEGCGVGTEAEWKPRNDSVFEGGWILREDGCKRNKKLQFVVVLFHLLRALLQEAQPRLRLPGAFGNRAVWPWFPTLGSCLRGVSGGMSAG